MEAAPEDAFCTGEEDALWLRNLRRLGTPGRQLLEHLQCVSIVLNNKSRAECPVQQVALFRRVFCRIYSQNPTCFNLPTPTPQFIAVVNLSGYRAILYSRRVALVRLLCMVGPDSSQRVMQNVQVLIHYAIQHKCTVLCCLSLPWQAGVEQVHWELRTLEHLPDGGVRDGARSYSYTHEEIRAVASSADSDLSPGDHMRVQMDAMQREFAACDLDTCVQSTVDMGADTSEKMQKMQGILAGMQADRANLHSQRAQTQKKHTSELEEARRSAQERIAKVVDATQVTLGVAKKKEAEMERQFKVLREQNSGLEKQNKQMKCDQVTYELRFCSERQSLVSKANVHELASKAAIEKHATLKKSSTRERSQMEKSHAKQVDDLERRVQEKTIEARKLERRVEELMQENKQLDGLVEQMREGKMALNYDLDSNYRRIIMYKVAVALVLKKHSSLRAEAARSEAAQAELVQMLATAEGSAHTTEEARAELELKLNEAAQQMAELQKSQTGEQPPARETASKDVNTEPQQDSSELTDLRAEVGQLNTEKEGWIQMDEDLRRQIAELAERRVEAEGSPNQTLSPTPSDQAKYSHSNVRHEVHNNVHNNVYNSVERNGGGAGWPSIDLGVDQHGDVSMEALVGQMQHSMRTIVDIARAGYKHKHAAENMWSELQALKRYSGDGSWQQAGFWGGEMVPVQPVQLMPWPGHAQPNGGAPRSRRQSQR
jgi:hypothetical protein